MSCVVLYLLGGDQRQRKLERYIYCCYGNNKWQKLLSSCPESCHSSLLQGIVIFGTDGGGGEGIRQPRASTQIKQGFLAASRTVIISNYWVFKLKPLSRLWAWCFSSFFLFVFLHLSPSPGRRKTECNVLIDGDVKVAGAGWSLRMIDVFSYNYWVTVSLRILVMLAGKTSQWTTLAVVSSVESYKCKR